MSKKQPQIVFENSDYLVAYKDAGILVQNNSSQGDSLSATIENYVAGKFSHLLTRLDRPVSGLVLFSKSAVFNKHFLAAQKSGLATKKYLALVEGRYASEEKELSGNLVHHKKLQKAFIQDEPDKNTRQVSMEVELVKHLDRYSVVTVQLKTGKFHQIRAMLSHKGYPIKGDVKYGARRKNHDRSIYLHAWKLEFPDIDGNSVEYEHPADLSDNLWKIAFNKDDEKL